MLIQPNAGAGEPREGEALLLLPLGDVGDEIDLDVFLDDREKRVEPVGDREPFIGLREDAESEVGRTSVAHAGRGSKVLGEEEVLCPEASDLDEDDDARPNRLS